MQFHERLVEQALLGFVLEGVLEPQFEGGAFSGVALEDGSVVGESGHVKKAIIEYSY